MTRSWKISEASEFCSPYSHITTANPACLCSVQVSRRVACRSLAAAEVPQEAAAEQQQQQQLPAVQQPDPNADLWQQLSFSKR